ncbi:MAG: nitroreductase family protein [Lachnospiraceae bacterium]
MTRITIDLSRCIGCGTCVRDCLMANLKLEGGTVTAGERCILCGHCVAVCPKNAVSLSGCAMGETEEYDPETFTVEPGQFLHAVKFRRSIRQFQKTMVSDEARDRILETSRYTATAANRQDNRLIWVQKELDELKETLWEELPSVIPLFEKRGACHGCTVFGIFESARGGRKGFYFLVRRCCWQSRDNQSWTPDWRRQTWR